MRILSGYVFRETLGFFAISLSAFTGLLMTVKMLRLTSLIINRGVEFSQIIQVFVAIIPTFLEIALPMATLLGVMLAFARMCGDSEMVVIRASGISLYQFLKPIGAFAVTIGLVSLFVSLVLRPWGFATLSQALFEVARSKSTSGLTEGVFNKLGSITLYAERIDYGSGDLARVLVDDRRSEQQRKIVIAKRGRIVADAKTHSIALLLGDGTAHELADGKYSRTQFTSNSLSIDPNELLKSDSQKGVTARELQTPQLAEVARTYAEALKGPVPDDLTKPMVTLFNDDLTRDELRKKSRRAAMELGQRYSLPFASFIMAFVGMALGMVSPRTQRAWGAGVSAVLGLSVFIVYYSMFSVGIALADSGRIPVTVALWVPNICTTLIAAFMMQRIGSEKWQSVPEGIQSVISRITGTFFRRRKSA